MRPFRIGTSSWSRDAFCSMIVATGSRSPGSSRVEWLDRGTSLRSPRPAGTWLAVAIRRRHDQDRTTRMLGDLVRDAPLEGLASPRQSARPDDDDGGVDLVRDVDDALPPRGGQRRPRL